MAVCLLVTLPLEFVFRARVYRRARRAVAAVTLAAAPFVLWDLVATSAGHWHWNPRYVTGVMLGPLPLEEVLFFVVVPLCGLLTYEAVRALLPSPGPDGGARRQRDERPGAR